MTVDMREKVGFHFSLCIFILSVNNVDGLVVLDFHDIAQIGYVIEFCIEGIGLRGEFDHFVVRRGFELFGLSIFISLDLLVLLNIQWTNSDYDLEILIGYLLGHEYLW